MKRIRITGALAFLVNGMLAVMTGTIITYLERDYGISDNIAGRLVAAQSVGNLIMVLLSGFVIQLIGKKKTLLLFPIFFAIGFGGIAMTDNVWLLFACFILTGLGWGLCNNILNNIIMGDSEGGGITVLYTCYAIGSFLGPFMVTRVIDLGATWKMAVIIVAVAAVLLIPGFLGAKAEALESKDKREKITAKDFAFFKNPRYYICMVLYFGYIGVEVSVNSWIITYLTRTGLLSTKGAENLFSLYWLIIIGVRLLMGAVLKKVPRAILLWIQWIGFALGTTALLLCTNGTQAIVFMIIMAVFMAAISPVNADNADVFIAGKGISGGIMFAVGCAGSTVLPMIVGTVAESHGIAPGMRIIVMVMYIMIAVCGVNFVIKRRK